MEKFLIQVKNLTHQFEEHIVLQNLNFDIQEGKITTFLGPSGCGKSTLLRLFAGFEKPTQGEISLTRPQKTSFVFQEPQLLPWRSVEENIKLPCELNHSSSEKLDHVLNLVKLQESRKKFPHQLSGGMKMRVSLARALITDPEFLLMDEPFSALDEISRFELQEQLYEIYQIQRSTILFVTHSMSEAVFLSHQIFGLSLRQKDFFFNEFIEFSNPRDFKLRENQAYNDYVTKITTLFRQERL